MSDLLSCIEINPTLPPIGSVILLHGLGADGHDFESIVQELRLPESMPLRFIFPHAPLIPVTINNGYVMRAWYNIVSLSMDTHADQSGIDQSVQSLGKLIEREEQRGIKSEKIILAGFSQGAVIALATGLTFPKKLGGIIALSGYLPQPEKVLQQASPANQNIPIFLAHGKQDALVPYFLGERLYQFLKANDYPVNWHSYDMAHSVCLEEIRDIAEWFKQTCN